MKTVVVGMSGGVDSSVTAALLKEQGHRVIGLFMKNWDEKEDSGIECTSARDYEDVARVCDRLDIPYYAVNFTREYWDNVFQEFLRDYQAGHTPNPDILCNREIKFKVFLEKAFALGADYLATGHYARIDSESGERRLLKGNDPGKDQSYFLYTLKKEVLEKVLFPVGDLPKAEVRAIAHKYDLATKEKKDSTGICFIGERDFPEFLSRYVRGRPGDFRTLNGEYQGKHRGAQFYTLGQRKGLGLGGQGEPWFVVAKDIEKNVVYVERGEHPAMYSSELTATESSWVSGTEPKTPIRLRAKVRYRQSDQECVIERIENGRLFVRFDQPQRAITPRQSVVFYDGELCLGGAIIEKASY
jgi:tRNA-specific 2-thiouridylase